MLACIKVGQCSAVLLRLLTTSILSVPRNTVRLDILSSQGLYRHWSKENWSLSTSVKGQEPKTSAAAGFCSHLQQGQDLTLIFYHSRTAGQIENPLCSIAHVPVIHSSRYFQNAETFAALEPKKLNKLTEVYIFPTLFRPTKPRWSSANSGMWCRHIWKYTVSSMLYNICSEIKLLN